MIKKKQTQKNPKPSISQRRQRCVCCLWAVWIQSCWKVNEIFRRSPLTSDCPAPLIGGCSHQSSVHVSCREPTAAFTLQSSSSLKSPKSRKPVIIVFICGQRFLRHTVLLQARTKAVRMRVCLFGTLCLLSFSTCVFFALFLLYPCPPSPACCLHLCLNNSAHFLVYLRYFLLAFSPLGSSCPHMARVICWYVPGLSGDSRFVFYHFSLGSGQMFASCCSLQSLF